MDTTQPTDLWFRFLVPLTGVITVAAIALLRSVLIRQESYPKFAKRFESEFLSICIRIHQWWNK